MKWAAFILPVAIFSSDISEYSNLYKAGSAKDRCCHSSCMVEVKTSKPDLVVKKINTTNKLSVYFEEDSSNLSSESIKEIELFLEKNPHLTDITVIGNTDGCGAPTYNIGLSGKRAGSVKNRILKLRNATIRMRWAGEIVANHSPLARRVDVVATSQVTLMEPLPRIISDFYLLDSSGSMANGNWQKFVRAISFHRKKGSRFFIATTECINRGSHINFVNPSGATEIWMSYWEIIDYMSPGQTLTIISDFESRYPLQPWEHQAISNKISKKNIIVRVIRL